MSLLPASGYPCGERLWDWQMGQSEDWQLENSPACRAAEADARLHEKVNTRLAPRRGSGEFMRRCCQFLVVVCVAVFAAGCPKDKHDYKEARRAVDLKDYDAAVDYYLKATKSDPHNVNYKIGLD